MNGATTGRIEIDEVSICFGDFVALEGATLTIEPGEFVCLLGPSGCGKTTLLNAIAGFVPIDGGTVRVDGLGVSGPHVTRGVVFQSAEALFPWLRAVDNVSFGSRLHGMPRSERRTVALEYLRLVGLGDATRKYPNELSGGMRQRLQIARVLANEPRIVLMDEPFGALDAQTREVMQVELDRIWRETGCTIVFVTHDLDEALLLADRVVTMTAAPNARIKNIHAVDLAHPRDIDDARLRALHQRLRADIAEEVAATVRREGVTVE
ncbi:MAG: ABC transporter ATP-binding protein [Acidimicrobiales bacterium]